MNIERVNRLLGLPFPMVDLYSQTEHSSLVRSVQITTDGLWRLSRRDSELHSVKVLVQGSCGWLEVMTGTGRPIFRQPSAFTGSFMIGAGCEEGLICFVKSSIKITVQLSWREEDARQI